MSLYRSSVISQVPINYRHANQLRRSSVTRASDPAELHFDVEEGDERRKKISSSESPHSKDGEIPDDREPYDCVSNPAPWHHQLTVRSSINILTTMHLTGSLFVYMFRSLFSGALIGTIFCIIVHKLNLTTGIVPSLNIAAGLLGFLMLRTWVYMLRLVGIKAHEFTPQENTVVQTCVVACYSLASSGGFGCYLLSMDRQTYVNLGEIGGNRPEDVYEPILTRIIPYMFCIALVGIFMLVIMRKKFIIDYRLHFPSGTATGILISGFHTPKGEAQARAQVKTMGCWGLTSFLWDFFKWFFQGDPSSSGCGFGSFPSLGLTALGQSWNFDWQLNYFGVGMIIPYVVSYSLMFGAILSSGIMWPLISKQEGNWYPAGETAQSFQGLFGYKNFLAIAIFIADGLYNFLKIGILSLQVYLDERKVQKLMQPQKQLGNPTPAHGPCSVASGATLSGAPRIDRTSVSLISADPISNAPASTGPASAVSMQRESVVSRTELERVQNLRDEVFNKGCIPTWVGIGGSVVFAVLAIIVIPFLYTPVKWYYVLVLAAIIPFFAVANAYGTGLTDFDMSSVYGTVAIFIIAIWSGAVGGGVISGLAVGGFVMAATSSAGTLMQDFKTGHITMSSPRSMFVAQIAGAILGCFIAPLTFQLFWHSFPIGDPNSDYKAPFANVYRGMAVIGTQMMIGFFCLALAMSLLRDLVPTRFSVFIPIPMAMAIPFYVGASVPIDICIGALIKAYWYWTSPLDAPGKVPAAASGLIAGDGLWTIPSCILSIAKVVPPICMSFQSSAAAVAAAAAAPAG